MVHVKRVELSHFKSFGGTTSVPFLPGFTVISGPNGSGKSNILDALLFCLGLASSKGMRAERLPDLINHNQTNNRKTTEASVSVTFDVSDLTTQEPGVGTQESGLKNQAAETENLSNGNGYSNNHYTNGNGNGKHDHNYKTTIDTEKAIKPTVNTEHLITSTDWTVTRRLRVSKGGSYASTYYINDQPCTVSELHEQLNRFRIYPEGYNVVLQGDVTRIIAMNSKERREIIDELAGVAEFDRKIDKTRQTLESVRDREEKCQIIAQELMRSLERLASDRIKAEKYQKLKAEVQQKQQWELVLTVIFLQQQQQQLQSQITSGEIEANQLKEQLSQQEKQIQATAQKLDQLNVQVKALGEDEQLSVASHLATQKAKRHQLQQQQIELKNNSQKSQINSQQTQNEIAQQQNHLQQINQQQEQLKINILPNLIAQRDQIRQILDNNKQKSHEIASSSEAWVQEQTALTRQIAQIQDSLNPQKNEQAQLTERSHSLERTINQQNQTLQTTDAELTQKQQQLSTLCQQVTSTEEEIKTIAQQLAIAQHDHTILQDTQKRLLKEQRDKQRELDKLEATHQAQQEAQGTYATQIILQSDLPGICGLVANLGQVDPNYQLALEIAAGARLSNLVVEDDTIAAAGIALLKQKRVGRATFLPLNKIQPPRFQDTSNLRFAQGFVDLAVNLVTCEPRYSKIFAYVFGSTIVFENVENARYYLGKYRIVTLEGELLELSGAMTGGNQPKRSVIRFGTVSDQDSKETEQLKHRLADIEQMLTRNEELISQKSEIVKNLSQKLTEIRQQVRELQLHYKQLEKDIERLTGQNTQLTTQLQQNRAEWEKATNRLQELRENIPILENSLQIEQQKLAELEATQTHSEWQAIQALIKTQEGEYQQREQVLRQAEEQFKDLQIQQQRLEEKINASEQHLQAYHQQFSQMENQFTEIQQQLEDIDEKIRQTETELQQLTAKLGETKQERDHSENELRSLQTGHQQTAWKLEKLQDQQEERKNNLIILREQLNKQLEEFPEITPELPEFLQNKDNYKEQLEQLQEEIRKGQKRLEAMEPVNMLALEEYENTKARVDELSEKLKTLEEERTELLLRVENFTTLRFKAFKEAFDAVNENFKGIFAALSDGDGYLQLDDEEDPFNGGLNLIAHPKGKPVQRLSSMSGGEKSLTALSFIFSLQRYRPSPFYAFDEVDMFLDGANVEKLSKMIRQQSKDAQFIVVSLRRPMIEASQRTIGVTQARGAYTQVLGIKL
jgi:chromosome segregation protein